jgi:hypothetical protein
MWTFETESIITRSTFVSSCRFKTIAEALEAISAWLAVSAENDFFPRVRLIKVGG